MTNQTLKDTIQQLFTDSKGLLARDESIQHATKGLQQRVFRRPLRCDAVTAK